MGDFIYPGKWSKNLTRLNFKENCSKVNQQLASTICMHQCKTQFNRYLLYNFSSKRNTKPNPVYSWNSSVSQNQVSVTNLSTSYHASERQLHIRAGRVNGETVVLWNISKFFGLREAEFGGLQIIIKAPNQ